ncbi:MAG: hypothetical protein ABI623_09790 [bacterium]
MAYRPSKYDFTSASFGVLFRKGVGKVVAQALALWIFGTAILTLAVWKFNSKLG